MSTKGDIVDSAYSMIRISGVTLQPDGRDIQIAIDRLESMMSELYELNNVAIGYIFTDDPDPADETGVTRAFDRLMSSNLALRLCSDFGKQAPQEVIAQAASSMNAAIGYSMKNRLKQVQYPKGFPAGSGNTLAYGSYKYFAKEAEAPTNSNWIYAGNILDFTENFNSELTNLDEIDTYTITADIRLTIVSSSESDGVITYRVQADTSIGSKFQQVRFDIMTVNGLEISRIVNFKINDPETVGGL